MGLFSIFGWEQGGLPSHSWRAARPAFAFGAAAFTRFASEGWWARQDSNLQPDRYERPALTIELQAPAAPGAVTMACTPHKACVQLGLATLVARTAGGDAA